jgi:hypothetical protein
LHADQKETRFFIDLKTPDVPALGVLKRERSEEVTFEGNR